MRHLLAAIAFTFSTFFPAGDPDRTRDIEKHFTTQPTQLIEITGFSGSEVKFRSREKNEVYIKVGIRLDASDESYEQQYIDEVSLIDTQTPHGVRISLKEPKSPSRSIESVSGFFRKLFGGFYVRKEVVGEIYVPQSNPLTTDLRYGSFDLENMKGSLRLLGTSNTLTLRNCSAVEEVENDYGKTVIENSGGKMEISGKSSRITVEDFKGSITMDAEYSTITLRNVTQASKIRSRSATINADDIGGDLSIDADYSTVTANKIAGMLRIENTSGKIRVKNADGMYIDANYTSVDASTISGKAAREIFVKGQSGSLHLEDAVGNVKIDNPYSTINLIKIKGNVDVSSKSARINGTDITGDWASRTEYSSVTVRGLSAQRIEMTNKSNPIDLQLTIPPTHMDIRNEYGSVTVSMPSGFSGEVDLNATYGKVDTNLPLEKTRSFKGAGAYAIGKVGSGNGKINIETSSANVKLMQR